MNIDALRQHYKEDRFWNEIWDQGEYAQAKDLEGDDLVIIDIGSLSGEFSWWMYDRAKRIYAIEPHNESFKELVRNVTEYDKEKKFILSNIALSDKNGEAKLTIKNRGGHTISQQGPFMQDVKTKSLESFMNENGIDKVDIIKFDVEGEEGNIFKDFDNISSRVRFCIGELHNDAQDVMTKIFERNNFEVEIHKANIMTAQNTKW